MQTLFYSHTGTSYISGSSTGDGITGTATFAAVGDAAATAFSPSSDPPGGPQTFTLSSPTATCPDSTRSLFRRCRITDYRVPSSGSPVFSEAWLLILQHYVVCGGTDGGSLLRSTVSRKHVRLTTEKDVTVHGL